jgi:hypothetical protein
MEPMFALSLIQLQKSKLACHVWPCQQKHCFHIKRVFNRGRRKAVQPVRPHGMNVKTRFFTGFYGSKLLSAVCQVWHGPTFPNSLFHMGIQGRSDQRKSSCADELSGQGLKSLCEGFQLPLCCGGGFGAQPPIFIKMQLYGFGRVNRRFNLQRKALIPYAIFSKTLYRYMHEFLILNMRARELAKRKGDSFDCFSSTGNLFKSSHLSITISRVLQLNASILLPSMCLRSLGQLDPHCIVDAVEYQGWQLRTGLLGSKCFGGLDEGI